MTHPINLMHQLLLEEEELFGNITETIGLQDGQVLFHRGDPGDAFYFIESGRVRIFTKDQDGKEITLNTMMAGETLGELAVLDAQPRSASAIALGDCRLIRINQQDFADRVCHSPRLASHVIRILSSRMRHMTEYIERLGHWSRMVIDGDYNDVIASIESLEMREERAIVAAANSILQMIQAVQEREENLRQELAQLKVEIDEEKRRRQVEELTESETFKHILNVGKKFRESRSSST